ncbi:hypothetical protein [Shouchella lonarensis]|uniref:Uncharacterized protein n=1 Tax=Shouchella lonarensis TaxID=1464122 RepID=A0A1G6HF92_9BACI|nr:hypothetical protein [Shouchella lonarensis]SDB92615.1 hypothetical protein SAMN05421737_103244 [Shouchella lonarensis]
MAVVDVVWMSALFLLFLLAGVFGGITLTAFMRGNKHLLKWSIPLALLCAILFIILMFVVLFQ